MKEVDLYSQYFKAAHTVNEIPRKAAVVKLTSISDAGVIRYEVSVNFFPHQDEEDYGVTYDALYNEVVFEGKGRRSKKREALLLEEVRERAAQLAELNGGKVFWDEPLREARYE